MECIFCGISSKCIPAKLIYEDQHLIAFNDLNPQAPVHVVIIPRKHIERIQDIENKDIDLMGHLLGSVPKIAKIKKIEKTGYRLVINCDKDAGQEVPHLHIHLLGGRKFVWPPG